MKAGKETFNMKTEIINNLNQPARLEKLFRDNKSDFRRDFNSIFPEIRDNNTARIWNERLNFENEEISWGSPHELLFVIIASLIAGAIAKIPEWVSIKPEYFYPRNIAFILFPLLSAYFAWKQKPPLSTLVIASLVFIGSVIYINFLPDNEKSDTLILACIHLPLFLWGILGFTYCGDQVNNYKKRLDFLRYNGDVVVMTTLILISGAILAGITIGLFTLIDFKIEEFYFQYVGIWGLAASPVVGTYLVQTNPQLVNKVSPIIAKVFTPLVLITLIAYLVAVIYSGKDPYNDRDFLLIFNLLLIGVMAIILFSIAETSKNAQGKFGTIMLSGLAIVTIIVNGIALSAIVFRISEWGITPNRLAVLGGNILILTNLLLVSYRLLKAVKNNNEIREVEKSIVSYLPIYILWAVLVTCLFPVLFNFR